MNNIFNSARVKLTLLYFAIICGVVVLFSIIVISTHSKQFAQFDQVKKESQLMYDRYGSTYALQNLENVNQAINQIKRDFFLNIMVLDLSILGGSALLSFYVSGKTLEPIVDALNKQKKFASDASHELRTPLTAIKTEAEVLARSKRSTLEEYKEFTHSLVEEVDKLSVLTEDLLQIAKIDNKPPKNNIEQVNLEDLVKNVLHRLDAFAERKGIAFKFKTPPAEIIVDTDKSKLERLIYIITENAIKYNKPDGSVELEIRRDIDTIAIVIRDSGVGIDAKDLPKIFDRFYRASEARSGDGFGLGLSIAKELAQQLHLQIRVQSEVGKGTTFQIVT